MEEDNNYILGEDLPLPPARLFERLAQLPGYIWDQTVEPFHSTYSHWHVFGLRHCAETDVSTPAATSSGPSSLSRISPRTESRPFFRHHWRSSLSESSSELSLSRTDQEPLWAPVVARVSSHVVRLEREFHMLRSIVQTSDPDCNHTIRPIDLIRLPPDPGDAGPLLVALFESPGPNMLRELVAFGPAWFAAGARSDGNLPTPDEQVSLPVFLDFAIGACDCLELLHYGLKTVHGEIRGDAFHFNRETGTVKLLSTGNGARSFENILSDGWSSLSRELGVKNKLQFVAPEQTGRMPTEPDSRTDIYALGVLFWTMLIGKPAFTGTDPVEVVQNVLGKKLPPVSVKRMDIPDAVSSVIQKMTHKSVNDRYHTISSVKRDLAQISQLLGDGDSEALHDFQIAQRDVSSFFTLPTRMFGRREEYNRIIGVIDKVYRRQQSAHARAAVKNSSGVGSSSSMSDGRVDSFEIASGSSDSGSFHLAPRSNSNGGAYNLGRVSTHESLHSTESSLSTPKAGFLSSKTKSPVESRSSWEHADRDSHPSSGANAQNYPESLPSVSRQKAAHKLRRNGICELITISGAAGIGKTDLLNRVQPAVRKLGYIAIARLDRARRIPFEPFAKILAQLLRQIFSERDVTTDYHNSVRMALRPMWPTLHRVLELPEQLMSAGGSDKEISPKMSVAQHIFRDVSSKAEPSRRMAMPRLDRGQSSVEFFLSNAASKNMRLMETFLEILKTLSHFRLICVCVDDLHYADDETLELILNIVRAKIPCVLMVTSRKAELESDAIKSLFETENPNVTRVQLNALGEDEIMQYVAATMHQDPNPGLTPLAAVIQEKSLGNPFYVRLMLETCYSKNCIWYSWKNSRWEFDLDRIFTEFVAPRYGEGLGLGFIAKRLQEIPPAARSIMIWGALLGSPFSFALVQKLLTSEFLYASEEDEAMDLTCPQNASLIRQSEADIVVGLQYLVQANLIVPGKTDDEFRFANDRLAQASTSLTEGRNVDKMHFIISQAMMKYYHDSRSRYAIARHIGLASRIVRSRVVQRLDYRKMLWDAAQTAAQSGARPTALWYFRHCIALLQDDPWDDNNTDVYYDETLRLHIATAEMLWSQGHHTEALKHLDEVFAHGKSAVCKARAWIVKAKIYAQMGNHYRSMNSLLTCLEELGVHLREPTTYEACDAAYGTLKAYLENADLEVIVRRPMSKDINMITIGTVMAEAMAVTYWDDALTFYRMAIEMMNLHLFKGGFVQISIGSSHLSMISFSRFRDLEFAAKLNECALTLLECCPEPWTQRRGSIVHNLYISHLRVPMPSTLPALETSVEASFSMGDPYITLISLSSMAMTRLWLGHDMGHVEHFCSESADDIPDWSKDTRGGASLLAVRQVARALQGKTFYRDPNTTMDDEHHSTDEYIAFLNNNASNADRPRDIYWGLAMIPLFLYGHHAKAIETGMSMMDTMPRLWSARVAYVVYFYLALSLLTLHNDYPAGGYLDGDDLKTVLKYKAEVDFARRACDANYGMWSLILEALIAEVRNDHTSAIQAFEAAIDHCQIHGWPMEEALALELHGEFLIRRGAKRAARSVMQDAIGAWSAISATGKAAHLTEKHEWLLKTATSSRCADAGVQTVDSLLGIDRNTAQEDMAIPQVMEGDDRKQLWIEQNGVTSGERSLDISGVGLDIIDLSSILESSQVMSSELQIDKLLTKMIEIVLESCNGSDFAVIATDFDDSGFAVAAAGDLEKGQRSFVDGLPLSEFEDKMAQQISHYVIRTKEEVLVHNFLEDDRFSNVNEAYQNKYPLGRSVIALPIMQADHLLGVIHIEGKPNSFTQRNVVVLHLLCNQIGISLANALLFREVRRVSATNAAMIEAQKRALAQAREAEQKAKVAEAEAKHNVKLKEDAAKAKSIFLANISHDLRTPMNGVIGLSELLKGTNLNKEQDEYVESIRVCADTLLTLINDILDFSKLEAGKMKISTVPLNIRETISEVVRALRYTHRDRGLETIEDLDKVPPDLVVLGDPVRLHQIFMNLLSNSYKFTPKGSITVRAKVSREGKGRLRLECAVSDTGIGIPEEQKSRLFKPFSQADSSTARSYGGSGLGLSICKAIIEDVLGGAIWLDSTPGVGTTVTFRLSFSKAKDPLTATPWSDISANNNAAPRPMTRDLTMIPRDQIRVCIAEDNPINQKIAVKFVTGLKLQCEAYSDGLQAVEALRARSREGIPFHVVLMDVQMPTLDGYNATREIRKDPDPNVNEVLVIAMTASAIEGDREKCLEAGMNNYLPKPVRSTVLSEMLGRYLAPAPTYTKMRLAMRARGSISTEAGTPTSSSSSTSEQVIALTPEEEKRPRLIKSGTG
ncbi:putative sensor histidine kinase/response regulator [Aspergillus clavatus NRRL 1]|uniref:histidine kinase n=1 Tax=Aspergillus clavatus (strain ATCC 1007 / CBS 513.65 / DSM 816 / NCTC 3887 / NRRL 1 / QM 1276 / 107) TaxID=344612 RepID=A1CKZ8_ASPCL|nr:sensor histidine kinase/response regulator, putative [Aspergillus clavatus NRRL 1]EAW09822.1 sensor histidine kinase/response regulator, putative [Aspergillus clavatus NRRL 1]